MKGDFVGGLSECQRACGLGLGLELRLGLGLGLESGLRLMLGSRCVK